MGTKFHELAFLQQILIPGNHWSSTSTQGSYPPCWDVRCTSTHVLPSSDIKWNTHIIFLCNKWFHQVLRHALIYVIGKIGPNPTRECVDWVRFHDVVRPETKFRQYLPAVLQLYVSAISQEDVYLENNKETLSKFCLGSKYIMKTTRLHILGLSMENVDNLKELRL